MQRFDRVSRPAATRRNRSTGRTLQTSCRTKLLGRGARCLPRRSPSRQAQPRVKDERRLGRRRRKSESGLGRFPKFKFDFGSARRDRSCSAEAGRFVRRVQQLQAQLCLNVDRLMLFRDLEQILTQFLMSER